MASDEGMEKLGVEEDDDLKKEARAGEDVRCPTCGKKVASHGNVHVCDEHGTEPFEKKE